MHYGAQHSPGPSVALAALVVAVLWAGATVGAAAALMLWALWGDPAGNFSGLLTD